MRIGLAERRSVAALIAISSLVALAGCAKKDDGIGPPVTPDGGGGTDAGVDSGSSFPDSGIGTGTLQLTGAVPDHGPFVGGNRVVLRGSGLSEDAVVTVGGRMVQPADLELIDTRRLSIVVPAGEPGPADVVVRVGDDEITLPGGYTYDRIYVDPSRGSVAGGTVVSVIGSGTAFEDGDEVVFGRTDCEDVAVVSETRITCKTPPMAAGTVDVTVVHSADGSETTASDAYTYYDGTDPYGGGLGGGPLSGSMNVTVIDATTGGPVPEAYVMVGEDLGTEHQGLTDLRGQITFSGSDLEGRHTVHVSKACVVVTETCQICWDRTSFVSFDATDVTAFLVSFPVGVCEGSPPSGRSRQGTFISGELIWRGPNEYGPNPWANIPEPREDEVKVAYVFTTQYAVGVPNPDPRLGGANQRVLEVVPDDGEDHLGYPYRIFARPAALAVYALGGLENTTTGELIPYVMGIARNVLGGPGEEVTGTDMVMNIPLDHTLDVRVDGLPEPASTGPDRFRVDSYIDLGGEGVMVRGLWTGTPGTASARFDPLFDTVRGRTTERPFRFWAQPALYDALSDGRYRIEAGWFTGDFDSLPYTLVVRNGVRDVSAPVVMDGFLGIPQATSPEDGGRIPDDRVLRWESDGEDPDLHIVQLLDSYGSVVWRHYVSGDVYEAPVPDLSSIPDIDDIPSGFLTWVVFAVNIPGFDFDEFSYSYLSDRFWSHSAVDYFTATK